MAGRHSGLHVRRPLLGACATVFLLPRELVASCREQPCHLDNLPTKVQNQTVTICHGLPHSHTCISYLLPPRYWLFQRAVCHTWSTHAVPQEPVVEADGGNRIPRCHCGADLRTTLQCHYTYCCLHPGDGVRCYQTFLSTSYQ